jgi:hypothetical protein
MFGLRYTLLDGRISDSRTLVGRYKWAFSINDLPVVLVGGGNGVVDTIAKGRSVAVAGRPSLLGGRFLAYQLWVQETGVTAGIPPSLPIFALSVTLIAFVVVALLGDIKNTLLVAFLTIVGLPVWVLMLSDTLNCRTLIRAARARIASTDAGLGSNKRLERP